MVKRFNAVTVQSINVVILVSGGCASVSVQQLRTDNADRPRVLERESESKGTRIENELGCDGVRAYLRPVERTFLAHPLTDIYLSTAEELVEPKWPNRIVSL